MMAHLRFRPLSFLFIYLSISSQTYARQLENDEPYEDFSFLTIQQSSLLPSDTCNPFITEESGHRTVLQLVHSTGPCSDKETAPPMTVLLQDQARVKTIHLAIQAFEGKQRASAVELPVYNGVSYETGNYIVQVQLGTPPVTQSLVFDTGSRTTWVRCQPCINCFVQKDLLFDPSQSPTYNQLSCSSSACSASPFNACSGTLCTYRITYGDRSYSAGVLSSDTLTLSQTDAISSFVFGCSNDVQGLFRQEAGLLGFSRAPLSFVSQTVSLYNGFFSYCLPSTESSTGFLALGSSRSANQQPFYIPLSAGNSNYYQIDLTGIAVGGRQVPVFSLSIAAEPMIVDSGTVITRLSTDIYTALRAAFLQGMSQYPTSAPVSLLDTCFDLSGYTTITLPRIEFTFNNQIQLRLPGSLFYVGNSRFCLSYTASTVSILGNTQQRTFEIFFDTFGKRLGFLAGGCN